MWRPLIMDREQRARVSTVVREIVVALAGAQLDPLQVAPHCDQLVLQAFVEEDGDAYADHLGHALHAQSGSPQLLGLYDGLARIGWTVAHLADDANAAELCASVDAALLGALDGPWIGSYDLISGLVGFGVYALERGTAGRAIAARVLQALRSRAEPRGPGLAWKTAASLLPPHQRTIAPNGYWNLGMAHGVPGVVAFCARCVRAEIDESLARELMNGAIEFLLNAEPPDEAGRFSAWHVEDVPRGRRTRLAWCYGDLGVASALLAAAQVEPRWTHDAISLARACARRRGESVHDARVCHGAAGIAHTFNRMYQATGEPILREAALRWLRVAIEMRTEQRYGGFPSRDASHRWRADPTLLSGAAGVALVLAATISETEPSWDRLLLLDLQSDPRR